MFRHQVSNFFGISEVKLPAFIDTIIRSIFLKMNYDPNDAC